MYNQSTVKHLPRVTIRNSIFTDDTNYETENHDFSGCHQFLKSGEGVKGNKVASLNPESTRRGIGGEKNEPSLSILRKDSLREGRGSYTQLQPCPFNMISGVGGGNDLFSAPTLVEANCFSQENHQINTSEFEVITKSETKILTLLSEGGGHLFQTKAPLMRAMRQ